MTNLDQTNTDVQIANLIQWLQSTAESSANFVVDQSPLIAQEFIRWEIASGIMLALFGIIVMMITGFWMYKGYKNLKSDNARDEIYMPAFIFGGILFLGLGLLTFSIGTAQSLKAYCAPRVVIIEKLGSILK